MQLSQKWKIFCDFFLHFVSLDLILNIFKKRMTLNTLCIFLNLWTPKDVVRKMSKKSCFRLPFDN